VDIDINVTKELTNIRAAGADGHAAGSAEDPVAGVRARFINEDSWSRCPVLAAPAKRSRCLPPSKRKKE
jgi:hypothetical protein